MMILITGAAGYIGSHTLHNLYQKKRKIVAIDNLYSGFKWAIPDTSIDLYIGNCGDPELLQFIFKKYKVESVIHFAAHLEVEESTRLPIKYYKNNFFNSLSLIEQCLKHDINQFIFSSTCAVYGTPEKIPVSESTPVNPLTSYGKSKLATEWALQDLTSSTATPLSLFTENSVNKLKFAILRYFNVAGAKVGGGLGQSTPNATQLIKVASEVAVGKRSHLKIFGSDYPTPDGTCVRDYIHVDDLAEAHSLALEYLESGGASGIFNCGYGQGFSVNEVVSSMNKVIKRELPVEYVSRRAGDAISIFADPSRVKNTLGWKPKYQDIDLICKTQYEWEKEIISRGL
ncbi:MAG: UDP-glucose 4-epimerase GalE [Oligoflexia bacterium]|nr:UDP-glucose 4-epimerase GalE [Oligoflexia bacterium]